MAKPKNSRAKGNTYERAICRKLSEWWFPDKDFAGMRADKLPFRRAWGSGGWDKREEPGDVKMIGCDATNGALDFPFCVEAKNRQEWDFKQLIANNNGCPVWDYWIQAFHAAEVGSLEPLLIFTRNYHPDYVALRSTTFVKLNAAAWRSPVRIRVPDRRPDMRVTITTLDWLLSFAPRDLIDALA